MKQEDKELLLRDISAKLPYGVYISPVDCGKAILIGIKDGNPLLWDTIQKKEYDKPWDIEFVKPYLRPMSSMTEEDKKEFSVFGFEVIEHINANREDCPKYQVIEVSNFSGITEITDWLNAHHFDYRGLIEKDLALEAPTGMYK